MIRATLLAFALAAAPLAASAQYIDAIGNRLNDGCDLDKYLAVVEEFRGVMTSQGYSYTVEIAQPLTGDDLTMIWWVGRTKDLATYGTEYSKWEAALQNPSSPEAKVSAKLTACSTNVSRSGSLVR
jgi:hypothetical protein